MELLLVSIIFILSVIVGSFLNVVILRLNTGYSILGISKGSGSQCLYCKNQLQWYELLPVISFFVIKGRCRECLTKLSLQYPIVEIVAGVIAVFNYYLVQPSDISTWIIFFLTLFIWWTMIVIFVYDLQHMIIPDQCVIFSLICAGILSYLNFNYWGDHLAGVILALPLALLWLFSGGKWIGLGDAKLVLVLGTMLGINQGILFFFVSFWIGALVSILFIFFSRYVLSNFKKINLKTEIPFGPFLIIGALMVYLLELGIVELFL